MTRLAVALLVLAAGNSPARPRVVIVKSQDLAAYSAVAASFATEARASVEEITLDEAANSPDKAFARLAENKPSLVLAIGPAAAVGAQRSLTDVPGVFVMVPRYDQYKLDKAPNLTGIALTSDLSLELSTLKAVLPRASVVGVVEDPRFSKDFVESAALAAQSRGQVLVPLEVDSAQKVEKVLKGAKGRVDALVLIADRTVGNLAVVQRLLQWGQDEKVPVVGFAPSQVKEGALFALAPMAVGVGQQAGRIANRILLEKVDPSAMAVAAPEGQELHVNLSTARKVANPKDFSYELFTFAARQGLAVRVIE